jgi:hypothetical protein
MPSASTANSASREWGAIAAKSAASMTNSRSQGVNVTKFNRVSWVQLLQSGLERKPNPEIELVGWGLLKCPLCT